MAEFLNTSGINYRLEKILTEARQQIVVISPYLKFNDRVRQRLEDQDRMKVDIRIVYGKSELQPQEIEWLRSLSFVRTSFCKNLHAKCYLNEKEAIVTSMNLYEFSQVNNHEMGILISKEREPDLYDQVHKEALSLVRISEEVRLSVEKVVRDDPPTPVTPAPEPPRTSSPAPTPSNGKKLSTSKIGRKNKLKTSQVLERLVALGYLTPTGDGHELTAEGRAAGGEFKFSKRFGPYFVWPAEMGL